MAPSASSRRLESPIPSAIMPCARAQDTARPPHTDGVAMAPSALPSQQSSLGCDWMSTHSPVLRSVLRCLGRWGMDLEVSCRLGGLSSSYLYLVRLVRRRSSVSRSPRFHRSSRACSPLIAEAPRDRSHSLARRTRTSIRAQQKLYVYTWFPKSLSHQSIKSRSTAPWLVARLFVGVFSCVLSPLPPHYL